MVLTRAKLERFTAFDNLDVSFSPGINVLVGENGTGKTHLMKACYAACDVSKTGKAFGEKLVDVFLPEGRKPGRLVKRQVGRARGRAEIFRNDCSIGASMSNLMRLPRKVEDTGTKRWSATPIESTFIPVKEMLANAPGFLSLYALREVHFEEVYPDLLHRAYRDVLRGPMDHPRRRLMSQLREAIRGTVFRKNEAFYLRSKIGNLEFTLLAEGIRKLGLLWLLIQNGTLTNGSVLFWDEPETNLNPSLFGPLIDLLIELQRYGVQIFIATHDYVILKELDLRMADDDEVAFHSLYRDSDTDEINCMTVDRLEHMHPNAIVDTFSDLYNRDVVQALQRFQN